MYADLENRKQQLIRKALQGSAFFAEIDADPIGDLTTGATSDLSPLPSGYDDLGWLTDEGIAFAGDTSQSDITSFGATTPTRSDITAETTTLTVVAQETKLRTIGLITGARDSAITADATTGEVRIDKPERPSARYYRVLALAVDESDSGAEIYIARFLPRAKVTSKTAPNFAGGDNAITYGVTLTGFKDSVLGYTESWIFGGPGWKELLTDMGIPSTTP